MSQPCAFVMDLRQWCTENNATPHCLPPSERHCHPRQITTDSREIPENGVYVPLQGVHFDGHDFITQSLSEGARLAFCQKDVYAAHAHDPQWQTLPLILVEDTLKAFQSLAYSWRRKLNTPLIAITGSSGKTSTKEILKQVFARDFNARKLEQRNRCTQNLAHAHPGTHPLSDRNGHAGLRPNSRAVRDSVTRLWRDHQYWACAPGRAGVSSGHCTSQVGTG